MPTRQTGTINFITTNPSTAAYDEGIAAAQKSHLDDLAIGAKMLDNAENLAAAPSRLRKVRADTDRAVADAAVATGTVDPRIAQAQSAASLAGTNAYVAGQTAPYKIDEAAFGARTARAGADVAVETAPVKVETARTGLRTAKAHALTAEMDGFYKSLDLANSGRVDEAKAVAQATGQQIPDVVFQNAEVRAAISAAAQRAKEAYPNRPRDQQTFIQGYIQDMAQRRQGGQAANAPAAPYQVPGAPEPPEDTTKSSYEIVHRQETDANGQPVVRSYTFNKTTGEFEPVEGSGAFTRAAGAGGGAAGRQSVFQQKQAAFLAVYPGDNQGALDYASGRRQLSDPEIAKSAFSLATREIANNQMLKFKGQAEQTAAIQKRAAEIAQTLRTGFGGAAAPAAGAPAGGPGQPPGLGTREQPYQGSTQDHVNWFKTQAPAGSVIIINGKPYTK
jgi:hypothetical protein